MRECVSPGIGNALNTLFCSLPEDHEGPHVKETAGGTWTWSAPYEAAAFKSAWMPDGRTPISQAYVAEDPPPKATPSARELAGYHAAMMLAESAHVALELIDGPASVRDHDRAAEILRTALGCTSDALEVAGGR